MSVLVSKVLADATKLLQDEGGLRRWPDDELLIWLNMGQQQIVILQPTANVTVAATQLAAGTLQTTPSASLYLLNITRNMGSDGLTPGRIVLPVDWEKLSMLDEDWHTATGSEVKRYVYDPKTPDQFWVYPGIPVLSTVYVELVYSTLPTAATSGGSITIPDKYEAPLLDYILYRAFSKDSDAPNSLAKSQAYFQLFMDAIGRRGITEATQNPKAGG